jgi:thiol-disulfide isomerase/thioredoxin
MKEREMKRLLSLLVASQFAFSANAGEYEDACLKAAREGKPLVVIVSAEWCAACVDLKQNVIEPMKKGELKDAVVVVVDYDKQPNEAAKNMKGEKLPQVAIYRFKKAWERVHEVGKLSRSRIVELLKKIKE